MKTRIKQYLAEKKIRLNKKAKFLARDLDGCVNAFDTKPTYNKSDEIWYATNKQWTIIDSIGDFMGDNASMNFSDLQPGSIIKI